MKIDDKNPDIGQRIKLAAMWILGFVAIIWLVELINLPLGHRLSNWGGIRPRTLMGLIGIPFSPFLHFGIHHVLLNTLPFIILGGFVILRGTREFLELTLFIVVLSGVAVWLFGRASYHAGASALIFGYFGYLVADGWYERNPQSIVIALVTLFLYGGILWGLLPVYAHISWEGHLFGLLSGVLGARLVKPK